MANVDHAATRIDAGQELKQIVLAALRALVESASEGATIDVGLASDDARIRVTLRLESLAASALTLDRRLDGSAGEFGLAIAAELVEQLGGRMRVRSDEVDSCAEIEVDLPTDAQSGGAAACSS